MVGKMILTINQETRGNLNANALELVGSLKKYKSDLERFLGKEISAEDALTSLKLGMNASIAKYKKVSLEMKYKDSIDKFNADYPGINEEKILDNFTSQMDEDSITELNTLVFTIKKSLAYLSTAVRGLELDHFLINDEIDLNQKVTSRIKESVTTYCANLNQVKLKKFAESISKIVKEAIKDEILSGTTIGAVAENFVNVNNGEIDWMNIRRF